MSTGAGNGSTTAETNDPKPTVLESSIPQQDPSQVNNAGDNAAASPETEFDFAKFFTDKPAPRKGFSQGCVIENLAASDCFWKYGADPCKPFFTFLKQCRAEEREKKRLNPPKSFFDKFRSTPPTAPETPPTDTTASPRNEEE